MRVCECTTRCCDLVMFKLVQNACVQQQQLCQPGHSHSHAQCWYHPRFQLLVTPSALAWNSFTYSAQPSPSVPYQPRSSAALWVLAPVSSWHPMLGVSVMFILALYGDSIPPSLFGEGYINIPRTLTPIQTTERTKPESALCHIYYRCTKICYTTFGFYSDVYIHNTDRMFQRVGTSVYGESLQNIAKQTSLCYTDTILACTRINKKHFKKCTKLADSLFEIETRKPNRSTYYRRSVDSSFTDTRNSTC